MKPEIALKYRAYEFKDAKRDATRLLSYPLSDPNEISGGDIKDYFQSMKRARELLYRDMRRAVNASKTIGLTNVEIVRILRASGVTQQDIALLLHGNGAPRWTPSRQFLMNARKGMMATARTSEERREVATLFRDRLAEVRRIAVAN